MDRSGNVDTTPARHPFLVVVPWYRTGGFLSLLAISLSAIPYLGWLAIRHYRVREKLIEQLSSARESAEMASRAKSEFLANMSHEIRTPMNGVLGMTELALQMDSSSDEQRGYLEMVKSSGHALLTVINDILDFSKIEAGKLDLDPVPFPLRHTLWDALRSVALRAHEKGLELAYTVADEVPDSIVGDPGRLRQIILNLTGNAIKFTEAGEVVLRVRVDARADQLTRLHFCIEDTGIGIRPEEQLKVFEPFSQADSSMTRRHGGTGLGLTISKQLVELMGGRVWIESEFGMGSKFHFTAEFGIAESPGKVSQTPACDLRGVTVLIVDDNHTALGILAETLSGWGMIPTKAATGAAALRRLDEQSFQLMLLDTRMPEMEDFLLAEHILQLSPESTMKTIAMTTMGLPDVVTASPYYSLPKPIKSADLLECILRSLASESINSFREEKQAGASILALNEAVNEGTGLKILVAEDNPVNQLLARRILEKAGHAVVIACDGRKALEAYETGIFDLILMDVQMPEMDGFAATAAIREQEAMNPAGSRMPILALTAHAMAGDRERCLAAGMDGFVTKPIQLRELIAAIAPFCPVLD